MGEFNMIVEAPKTEYCRICNGHKSYHDYVHIHHPFFSQDNLVYLEQMNDKNARG